MPDIIIFGPAAFGDGLTFRRGEGLTLLDVLVFPGFGSSSKGLPWLRRFALQGPLLNTALMCLGVCGPWLSRCRS